MKTEEELIWEAYQINYKTNYDLEFNNNVSIEAFINNIKIGGIYCSILTDFEYEFDDIDDIDLDDIFPDFELIKINEISIEKNYRGEGIAKELMSKIINLLKNKSFTQLYLNASPMGFGGLNKIQLIEFYKKFGFKILKDQGNNTLMYRYLNK